MPVESLEPFGHFVRRIRLEKNMSQIDVEKNGGPTQTTVSDYEKSADTVTPKRPTRRMVVLFARGLGIPIEEVERKAGLLPGGSRQQIPAHAVAEELYKVGMRPAWLSTGDVVYLTVENTEQDDTLIALEAFLEGWYARRDFRAARRQKRDQAGDPVDETAGSTRSTSD